MLLLLLVGAQLVSDLRVIGDMLNRYPPMTSRNQVVKLQFCAAGHIDVTIEHRFIAHWSALHGSFYVCAPKLDPRILKA